jgi:hypothetical protein
VPQRLVDLFPSLKGPCPLLPEASGRFANLASAAVTGLFVMRVSLHFPKDAIAEDQFLEESERALHPAIPHGHFQRTMVRCVSSIESVSVSILPTSKGHTSPLVTLMTAIGKGKRRED